MIPVVEEWIKEIDAMANKLKEAGLSGKRTTPMELPKKIKRNTIDDVIEEFLHKLEV
jgi:hypothetical protein